VVDVDHLSIVESRVLGLSSCRSRRRRRRVPILDPMKPRALSVDEFVFGTEHHTRDGTSQNALLFKTRKNGRIVILHRGTFRFFVLELGTDGSY
jgi:hypothetical protein